MDEEPDVRLEIEETDSKANITQDPLYVSLKNKFDTDNWNDNGLVTLKGFQIPGSDIVDLIAGALDQSYSNRNSSSPGKDAFEKWINKLKGSRYKMTKPLPITPTTPPGATQVAPTQSPTQSPITQLQTP
ncbi:unnamed protein product [Rotaria socialis]|uniref:Uncharacterized protein n=1 Tax=Rotaria socialis TaxID=392032 RepID=A0A818I4E0_9BILA|nr:unnamed protein product [Rotaria socialis]